MWRLRVSDQTRVLREADKLGTWSGVDGPVNDTGYLVSDQSPLGKARLRPPTPNPEHAAADMAGDIFQSGVALEVCMPRGCRFTTGRSIALHAAPLQCKAGQFDGPLKPPLLTPRNRRRRRRRRPSIEAAAAAESTDAPVGCCKLNLPPLWAAPAYLK